MPEREIETRGSASNVRRDLNLKVPLGIFVVASLASGIDAVLDVLGGSSLMHVSLEVGTTALAIVGAVLLLKELNTERKLRALSEMELVEASENVSQWKSRAEQWRQEYEGAVRGLGEAIEAQFSDWKLSPAESEVCFLLLKGLSFKEVGTVRDASERTVRQQANAAYKKAGLGGRAELSAYFLEDLVVDHGTVAPSNVLVVKKK